MKVGVFMPLLSSLPLDDVLKKLKSLDISMVEFGTAGSYREVSRKTILLAEKLGVKTVVDFSGCPGDSPEAKSPNWVTCPWPRAYLDVLNWQWDTVVAPYWQSHGKFAADHGVKIAIEMHRGALTS